jgi:hypothetical protein
MMARRIDYSLISVFGVLLAIGSALGAGMMTFTSEQKAQQHCPSDTRLAQHNEHDLSF